MRLLVGIDKRDGGEDALELARVLGSGKGDSALVVSVLYGGAVASEYVRLPDEETAELEPCFEAARTRLAGFEIESRAYGGGSPAGLITLLAEEGEFDAIVVGSPHRGPIGRVMIGSVATSLLNGAPTDVAVAPRGYAGEERDPPRKIGVGYDGTPEAEAALRRAETLALRSGATIEVLTVVRPPMASPVFSPGVYSPQSPADPEQVLNEGVNSVDPGLAATRTRLDGDPATELLGACERGLDLIVVGSRGYGPMTRVLLGSVGRELASKAPCPVLIARRP